MYTKSAFITGASKGIGFEVAKALANEGYAVTITSRSKLEIERAASLIGKNASGVVCDVQDPHALLAAINTHQNRNGGLDVLFVNAGIGHFARSEDLSLENWKSVIDTNLSGAFYTVKAAIPSLKIRGGYIFMLSSLAGKNPFVGGAAYNASKFGLNGLSEVLMLELRDFDIKVTQIMPGSVATHFNGRPPSEADAWKIQAEDIALLTTDLLKMPKRTLPSKVEIRPSKPNKH